MSTFHSLVLKKKFYEDNVKIFVALAPTITLNYTTEEFLVNLAEEEHLGSVLNKYGFLEAFPSTA